MVSCGSHGDEVAESVVESLLKALHQRAQVARGPHINDFRIFGNAKVIYIPHGGITIAAFHGAGFSLSCELPFLDQLARGIDPHDRT